MPPEKVITIPSGSTRLSLAFLYSFPSIVLKSSARATDATQRIKKSANLFISKMELKENSEASESRSGLQVEAISHGSLNATACSWLELEMAIRDLPSVR